MGQLGGDVLGTSEKQLPEAGEEWRCRMAASDRAGGIQHSSSGFVSLPVGWEQATGVGSTLSKGKNTVK